MAKRKKNITVGRNQTVKKNISKPMVQLILTYQKNLQKEENNRKNYKPRKITFLYASLELSKIIRGKIKL